MTHQETDSFRLQTLAILAVRLGRELGDQLAEMRDAPVEDLPRSYLSAMMLRLESGEVTDNRDLVALKALHFGLAARMSQEILGSKVESHISGHDEDGEVWSTREVYVYSDRGAKAQSIHDRLERFLDIRQQLLDRANAERLAASLLR
jgi:hypothetical protein